MEGMLIMGRGTLVAVLKIKVKPFSADGTTPETVWESRSPPFFYLNIGIKD